MVDRPPQLPNESDDKYRLFRRWLDHVPPTATAKQAAAELGITPGNYRVTKGRFNWDERRAGTYELPVKPQPEVITVELLDDPDQWRDRYQTGMTQLAALAPEAAKFCGTVLAAANEGQEIDRETIALFRVLITKFLPDHVITHTPGGDDFGGRAEALGLTSPNDSATHLRSLGQRLLNMAEVDQQDSKDGS